MFAGAVEMAAAAAAQAAHWQLAWDALSHAPDALQQHKANIVNC
jgi:hypothetical protein